MGKYNGGICAVTQSQQPELEALTRTQVLVAMGLTAVLWLIAARVWLLTPYAGGLLPFHWNLTHLGLGVGVSFGILAASSIVYQLWPQYRQAADFYLHLVIKPLVWSDLIWLGLLPGLSEELLFRGVVLPTAGLNWFGLVISSLCFGILHLSGKQQWPYVIWASVVGAALGYSAIATRNLMVPVVAHILTNIVASALWKWQHRPKSA
jgi:uncharacterized protein